MRTETEPLIRQGAIEFLDSLAALWDLLNSALLSGKPPQERIPPVCEQVIIFGVARNDEP